MNTIVFPYDPSIASTNEKVSEAGNKFLSQVRKLCNCLGARHKVSYRPKRRQLTNEQGKSMIFNLRWRKTVLFITSRSALFYDR